MSSRWVVIALAVCAAAQAQAGRVRIAPLPIKVLTGDDKLDRELPKQFEVHLLRTQQVECPLSDKVEAFLQTRAGAPCDKDAACLKTLAENTASLYSLAATVRLNGAATAFVVSATLFRVDGQKKDIAFEYKIDREVMTVPAAGEEALKELVARLELEKLDRELPLAAAPRGDTVPAVVAADEGATGRLVGEVVAGVGAASVVVGAILMGVGGGQARGIPVDVNGNVPTSQMEAEWSAIRVQNAGGAMLGIGVAVAAAGGIIWLMAPSASAQVSVGPMAGGAAVTVKGALPW